MLQTAFLGIAHPLLLPTLEQQFFSCLGSPSALTRCDGHHKPQEKFRLAFAPC